MKLYLQLYINRSYYYHRCFKCFHEKYFKIFAFLIIAIFLTENSIGQSKENLKVENSLLEKIQVNDQSRSFKILIYISSNDIRQFILNNSKIKIIRADTLSPIISAETDTKTINELIYHKGILFISESQEAKEELLSGAVDYTCNNIRLIQSQVSAADGKNTFVSVKENLPDTTDIDLKGRYINTGFNSTILSTHASLMSTIIGGAGNSWINTKGVAPSTKITSTSFAQILPETDLFYQNNSIDVQNHSYGTKIQNYYGIEASAYDASANNLPTLLHVFSAGNDGQNTPMDGQYANIKGYSNLTGNFKQAKNIIVVGHTDSTKNILSASSSGPAFDGRIKPELVAYGEDGSSGAAAIVSGISLILQQYYKEQNNGKPPPASLIKSILINGSKDVGPKGIDFKSGFGSVDAWASYKILSQKQFVIGEIGSNQNKEYEIFIPTGIREFKLSLVWTDPAALPQSQKALSNDLDLELHNVSTKKVWHPWVLNHNANTDSLKLNPIRKRDTLNNVEQISIDYPEAGVYVIKISSRQLITLNQEFTFAYRIDSVNNFYWEFPAKNDLLQSKNKNLLRWNSTLNASNGALYLSTNKGNTWELISSNVDLKKENYPIELADHFGEGLLKMETGKNVYYSDPFIIGGRLQTYVGFNCPDSFRIYWEKIKGINEYRVFQLGKYYLDSLTTISDTSIGFKKINQTSEFYSIAPVLNQTNLSRSYTFNYKNQGVDCYFRSFIGYVENKNAKFKLSLGSIYGIKAIRFEKITSSNSRIIGVIKNPNLTNYELLDSAIQKGTNRYRIILELSNNLEISSTESVLYFTDINDYLVYPNPSKTNSTLTVLSDETSLFQILDITGRKIYQKTIEGYPENIKLGGIMQGIYIYRFLKGSEIIKTGKIVIIE